ncbi:hypothetical protein BJV82DRAFT_369302 [Fennellomyces sp. T-0311]|nr:hypothetical protein BJV82DRAFT_369302 [Fennellomyces sp. T-0311]
MTTAHCESAETNRTVTSFVCPMDGCDESFDSVYEYKYHRLVGHFGNSNIAEHPHKVTRELGPSHHVHQEIEHDATAPYQDATPWTHIWKRGHVRSRWRLALVPGARISVRTVVRCIERHDQGDALD